MPDMDGEGVRMRSIIERCRKSRLNKSLCRAGAQDESRRHPRTNTSSIPLQNLPHHVEKPSLVGLHFFIGIPLQLVEVCQP